MDIETQPFYHEQYASFVDNSYVDFTINLKGGNRGVDYAAKENTHASAADYLRTNTDIDKKWRGTAWEHYSLHGKKEGRKWNYIPDIEQSEEAAQDYLINNPDVAKSWKGKPAYLHWLYYGQYETPARVWNANATASSGGTATTTPSGGTGTPAPSGGEGTTSTDVITDKGSADDAAKTAETKKDGTPLPKKDDTKPKWMMPAIIGGSVLALGAIVYLVMKKKTV